MKKLYVIASLLIIPMLAWAQDAIVLGPDQNLKVTIQTQNGTPTYAVTYKGKQILEESPLGLLTNVGDFSKDMIFKSKKVTTIDETYPLTRAKSSKVHYQANEVICTFENSQKRNLQITFRVSNNDVAFRYSIPQYGETACCVIEKEATGFDFPQQTTTFLTPQATPMIGWMRTKPSYEEEYVPDDKLGAPSKYGVGFTFPGLFHIGENGWALVSETGVTSDYCASHLSEGTSEGLYTVAFPHPKENNGFGSATAAIALPGVTPWRTITVGEDLKPIVETTVPFDVVKPLYEPSQDYKSGRSTWSWIMWQDPSINYKDQIAYIDLAQKMGYEYCLIDGGWEENIGYQGMEKLFKYAQDKGVNIFVWYNSNGHSNDAPQSAKQRMANSIARKKEMKWLKTQGVKGLKVDFFGGDKQETMKLYEDILSDANEYGLMIIFHGCTIPRGWERMYPNYVGSEAVLASENLIFNQHYDDNAAFNACLHPFIRNAIGSMEFGGTILNKRLNRQNNGGTIRKTTDVFEIATAVVFQNSIQNFALAPNNLEDAPAAAINFMKTVPTTWDETRYIAGYPGKYVVLARRHGEKWYIAALNAQKETFKVKVNLPMLAGKTATHYFDEKKTRALETESVKINKKGDFMLTIPQDGGSLLIQE